ncbi:lipoprotein NlpI [Aquisphaera giovannonii]|uniref:Lipoprotein NlpI n=1 Tax=Aquisphaera giovannonii TaxID=406548 RepID=A0A5B9W1L9_9BACT|nr:tetratricopeptide repeat protein [Aquisphaera giovannonii]QEH34157.1 lipoprotein NlpI [Aquisphaera giovannonii]
MRGAELYDRVINAPGLMHLVAAFGVGVGFIMLAATFLAFGRVRVLARFMGVLGIAISMLALFVVHEQTVEERAGQYVTVTRYRYPESTRFQVRVALLGLPAAAAVVTVWVLGTVKKRLRSSVPDHMREGRKLLLHGRVDEALVQYNKAIAIAPYLGEAHLQRGYAREAKGETDLALQDFNAALDNDPQLVLAHLHRGRILTEKGELDAAMQDFDKVMALRPNDPECYLNRGVCQARRGQIDEAILDFQRVLKLTNHTDYAEPARFYLQQLGGVDPTVSPLMAAPLLGPNGAAGALPGRNQAAATDHGA